MYKNQNLSLIGLYIYILLCILRSMLNANDQAFGLFPGTTDVYKLLLKMFFKPCKILPIKYDLNFKILETTQSPKSSFPFLFYFGLVIWDLDSGLLIFRIELLDCAVPYLSFIDPDSFLCKEYQ